MPAFTIALTAYLIKHYVMNHTDATVMIDGEWEYIEDRLNDGCSVEELSEELVEIYMTS